MEYGQIKIETEKVQDSKQAFNQKDLRVQLTNFLWVLKRHFNTSLRKLSFYTFSHSSLETVTLLLLK